MQRCCRLPLYAAVLLWLSAAAGQGQPTSRGLEVAETLQPAGSISHSVVEVPQQTTHGFFVRGNGRGQHSSGQYVYQGAKLDGWLIQHDAQYVRDEDRVANQARSGLPRQGDRQARLGPDPAGHPGLKEARDAELLGPRVDQTTQFYTPADSRYGSLDLAPAGKSAEGGSLSHHDYQGKNDGVHGGYGVEQEAGGRRQDYLSYPYRNQDYGGSGVYSMEKEAGRAGGGFLSSYNHQNKDDDVGVGYSTDREAGDVSKDYLSYGYQNKYNGVHTGYTMRKQLDNTGATSRRGSDLSPFDYQSRNNAVLVDYRAGRSEEQSDGERHYLPSPAKQHIHGDDGQEYGDEGYSRGHTTYITPLERGHKSAYFSPDVSAKQGVSYGSRRHVNLDQSTRGQLTDQGSSDYRNQDGPSSTHDHTYIYFPGSTSAPLYKSQDGSDYSQEGKTRQSSDDHGDYGRKSQYEKGRTSLARLYLPARYDVYSSSYRHPVGKVVRIPGSHRQVSVLQSDPDPQGPVRAVHDHGNRHHRSDVYLAKGSLVSSAGDLDPASRLDRFQTGQEHAADDDQNILRSGLQRDAEVFVPQKPVRHFRPSPQVPLDFSGDANDVQFSSGHRHPRPDNFKRTASISADVKAFNSFSDQKQFRKDGPDSGPAAPDFGTFPGQKGSFPGGRRDLDNGAVDLGDFSGQVSFSRARPDLDRSVDLGDLPRRKEASLGTTGSDRRDPAFSDVSGTRGIISGRQDFGRGPEASSRDTPSLRQDQERDRSPDRLQSSAVEQDSYAFYSDTRNLYRTLP